MKLKDEIEAICIAWYHHSKNEKMYSNDLGESTLQIFCFETQQTESAHYHGGATPFIPPPSSRLSSIDPGSYLHSDPCAILGA